ncbi:MAG: hypothetical protein M3024_15625 [Candidatus Dormibacteraeota bacterium]|nr:hypothetical protein [Candidatus Dormibacteraeota bacterium]
MLSLRPIDHPRDRRVETHVFLTYFAFRLAKTLEQKLQAPGSRSASARPWSNSCG